MAIQYSIADNKFIIKRPNQLKNILYKIVLLLPIIVVVLVNIYIAPLNLLGFIIIFLFAFYFAYTSPFHKPAIFTDVSISKYGKQLILNGKHIVRDDILFLSFREADDCQYIKLEMKRKRIYIANEILLCNECTSYDEALELCRAIRDFIDEGILINYMSMAWAKSNTEPYETATEPRARKSALLENWNYVE
jgi:hypothetical protein